MTDNILPFRKKENRSENTCRRREEYIPLDKETFYQELCEITESIHANLAVTEEFEQYYIGGNKNRTELETKRFFKQIKDLTEIFTLLIMLLRQEKRPKEYEKTCEAFLKIIRIVRNNVSLILIGIKQKSRPAQMKTKITHAQKDINTYLSHLSTFMNTLE